MERKVSDSVVQLSLGETLQSLIIQQFDRLDSLEPEGAACQYAKRLDFQERPIPGPAPQPWSSSGAQSAW